MASSKAIPAVSTTFLTILNGFLFVAALVPLVTEYIPSPAFLYDAQNQHEASLHPNPNATVVPYLLGLRNETGYDVLTERKRQNFPLYYWLHVFPSMAWCVIMPLQHVESIRKSYRKLHVLSGYAIVAMSTVLSISGILFPLRKLSHTHANLWHVHTWAVGPSGHKITILAWPTFAILSHFFGVTLAFLAIKTLLTGLSYKKSSEHRTWATTYTYYSYIVPIHRVWISASQVIGVILLVLPDGVKDWLSVPNTEPEIFKGEMAAFAWATLMAALSAVMLIWWNVWVPLQQNSPSKVKAR